LVKYASGIALVLEDFSALPLKEILNEKMLTVSEILQIIVSFAKLLGELHRHDIIHKDIQPENIFVGSEIGTKSKMNYAS